MKTVTAFRPTGNGGSEGSLHEANKLNLLFNRLETFAPAQPPLSHLLSASNHHLLHCPHPPVRVPITPPLLPRWTALSKQMPPAPTCNLYSVLYSSLCLRVTLIWKCLIPVPKTLSPSGPKDYRPVALTLETLEGLVLEQLQPMVR